MRTCSTLSLCLTLAGCGSSSPCDGPRPDLDEVRLEIGDAPEPGDGASCDGAPELSLGSLDGYRDFVFLQSCAVDQRVHYTVATRGLDVSAPVEAHWSLAADGEVRDEGTDAWTLVCGSEGEAVGPELVIVAPPGTVGVPFELSLTLTDASGVRVEDLATFDLVFGVD